MALSKAQIEDLRKQLHEQIEHLPPERKKAAKEQIDSMSPESIETMFLQQQSGEKTNQKAIFRSIIDGDIPAKKIDENKSSIAVLDIRPISKGHTIIITKKQVSEIKNLPSAAFNLAKKVGKKIVSKLKAKNTEVQTEFKFGEMIINVIPVYDKSLNLNSPRTEFSEEELNEIQAMLKVKPRSKSTKKKAVNDNVIRLKRRIP